MKAPLAAFTFLALTVTAHADPQRVNVVLERAAPSKTAITPESRAVLERAARFYGGLKSLSLSLNVESNIYRDGNNIPVSRAAILRWERRGLLRFESPSTRERVVVDGNRVHQLWKGQYRSDGLDPRRKADQTLSTLAAATGFSDVTTLLSDLLRGKSPILNSLDEYSQLKASLKPSEMLDGVACEVVEISGSYDGDEGSLAEHTLWFARSDGHLLRIVSKSFEGEQWRNIDDVRFEEQKFNTPFALATFQFGLSR